MQAMDMASIGLLSYVFQFVWFAFAVVVLVLLIRLYTRTRMSGFIWLIVTVVVWPLVSRVLFMVLPMSISALHVSSEQYALINVSLGGVEGLIGSVLMIVSLVILYRQLDRSNVAPVVSGMPPYPGTF